MQKIVIQTRSAGKTSSVRAAVSAAARLLRKAGYIWENGEWKAPARRLITIWARNGDFDLVNFRDEWARLMRVDSRMPGLRLIDLAEVQAESVPNLTPSAIAAAVCQRVAELDDRSSPADWPEAMLVTADELQTILIEELAAALPVPQAKPADALPLTDDQIEAEFTGSGGMWTGEYWKIEDADLHPYVRKIKEGGAA